MSEDVPGSNLAVRDTEPTTWEDVREVYEKWHPALQPYVKHHLAAQGLLPPPAPTHIETFAQTRPVAEPVPAPAHPDPEEQHAEPTTDAEKIKQHLEAYFSSDLFTARAEVASQGDFELRSDFIGELVQYSILFPDDAPDKLDEYAGTLAASQGMNRMQMESQKSVHITNRIAETLGIPSEQIEARKEDIARYAFSHYVTDGFVFHGFNSHVEQSIREHGLSGEKRAWDNSDLQVINGLFARYGVRDITGWHDINSVGKFFVSEDPKASYSYAARSPEWFSSFTGGSMNYADIRQGAGRAFTRRDREAAQYNIQTLMAKVGFAPEDKQQVMDFFDKHWDVLAENTGPRLALVDRTTIDGYRQDNFASDYAIVTRRYNNDPERTASQIVGRLLDLNSHVVDRSERKAVPPEAITIVNLPR